MLFCQKSCISIYFINNFRDIFRQKAVTRSKWARDLSSRKLGLRDLFPVFNQGSCQPFHVLIGLKLSKTPWRFLVVLSMHAQTGIGIKYMKYFSKILPIDELAWQQFLWSCFFIIQIVFSNGWRCTKCACNSLINICKLTFPFHMVVSNLPFVSFLSSSKKRVDFKFSIFEFLVCFSEILLFPCGRTQ